MTDIQAQDYGLTETEERVFAVVEKYYRIVQESIPSESEMKKLDFDIESQRLLSHFRQVRGIAIHAVNMLAGRDILDDLTAAKLALAGARRGCDGPVDGPVAVTQEFIMYYFQNKD